MVDVNVVAFKIGELKDRMDRVRSHCPERPEDFVADRDALDIVSFNLLLAVQSSLDLAIRSMPQPGPAFPISSASLPR